MGNMFTYITNGSTDIYIRSTGTDESVYNDLHQYIMLMYSIYSYINLFTKIEAYRGCKHWADNVMVVCLYVPVKTPSMPRVRDIFQCPLGYDQSPFFLLYKTRTG